MAQALLALAGAALLGASTADAYFIVSGGSIVTQRIDPIVSPGAISAHVHNLVGANNVGISSSYESLQEASCTSVPVTVDKSAYWQPQLYYYNTTDQSYSAIKSYSNIYYLQRTGPKNPKEKLHAFPPGFRMLAGSPLRHTRNASSFADQAIDFVCQDYYNDHRGDPEWDQRPTFFNHNCPNGMRAQVVFPACWNGVDLYKTDNSHVAYPIQNVNGGDCPATHPIHLITLFQEFVYDVGSWPYNTDGPTWAFATGDTVGLSLHADFQNGWDVDVLQAAVDECTGDIGGGLKNCPPLAPYYDTNAAAACKVDGLILDEDVGLKHSIPKLPGCNPLWTSGPKPACSDPTPDPGFVSTRSTPAPGYSAQGCVAEPSNGKLLVGAKTTSDAMSAAVCTAFCAQQKFEYAGVEYGRECYCGSSFSNGGTGAKIADSQCRLTCSGSENEVCGGYATLSLFRNPSYAVSAAPLPAGWKSAGCIADNVNSTRTLKGYTTASRNMTLSSCVNTCNSRGFLYAGVEYASECYCSNEPSSMVASDKCNMPCSGDARYMCGGPSALSLFTSSQIVSPGYKYTGCVAEGTTGRLLTGASTTSDSMTPLACTSFCANNGLQYSGVEYGRECYCGFELTNGGSNTLIDESRCGINCAGDASAQCGGYSTMSLFRNTALAPKPVTLPAGWSAIGCIADSVQGRTLPAYTFAARNMTYGMCLNGCQAKGYSLAGVEYSSECWCANAMVTNVTSNACSMPCSGDNTHYCGGRDALTAFSFSNSTAPLAAARRSAPKQATHRRSSSTHRFAH